jgi:hypothetical protein
MRFLETPTDSKIHGFGNKTGHQLITPETPSNVKPATIVARVIFSLLSLNRSTDAVKRSSKNPYRLEFMIDSLTRPKKPIELIVTGIGFDWKSFA